MFSKDRKDASSMCKWCLCQNTSTEAVQLVNRTLLRRLWYMFRSSFVLHLILRFHRAQHKEQDGHYRTRRNRENKYNHSFHRHNSFSPRCFAKPLISGAFVTSVKGNQLNTSIRLCWSRTDIQGAFLVFRTWFCCYISEEAHKWDTYHTTTPFSTKW